jgi:malonate-semialdehyde dehydrogenase (acetylating)/methylmalonate-semialdehyde dehydrogenase
MDTAQNHATALVPNLIGDRWEAAEASRSTPVHNPSSGEVIAQTPHSGAEVLDAAVSAAREAFRPWSETPVTKRASLLFRYKALLEENFEPLARLITRENGKTLAESRGDVRRGIEVVDFACGIPHLLKGETIPQIAASMDALTTLEPLGVCAGITPFNFPAMVPMWMFPLALACGNSFILKPSEKVPLTANRLAELALEAGIPPGVLNVVHGAREVVDAICAHPDIAAISFVGSSAVAHHVYKSGCANGKRVQAAGGAKNVLMVMPDAEPDSTIRAIMGAAFGCAGQRCMAGSLVLGLQEHADGVVKRLREAAASLKLLPTDRYEESGMGPVIDAGARERLLEVIRHASDEGAALALDGRENLPPEGFFVGPSIVDHVTPEMTLAREELFGPVLSVGRPAGLDEAVEWINEGGYGNGAVIFTRSGAAAREFTRRVQCGMVGVNVGVPAPMSVFAFSGWNRSFYGDLHVQGMEGVRFYTRQKVAFSRWDDAYVRVQGW